MQNLFLLLCLLLCLFSIANSDELQLLLKIKTSLQNPNTNVFYSWNPSNHVCNFTGITCYPYDSITSIQLSNQKLTGSVPFDSICQLKSLQKLSLAHNSLHGPLSDSLKNCVNLKTLDLSNNLFSGSIPNISSLNQLTHLYLNRSGFSGTFPWYSLENMTELNVLSIGDNRFDSSPFPVVVTKLSKLSWVFLSNCSISGRIPPGIGNLRELINLEVSDNDISGEIPPEISKLTKLWQFEFYRNRLTGKIPLGFGNLSNLEMFDGSVNFLEGDLSELRNLTNLVSLHLYDNGFSGEVPAEFGSFNKLKELSLYRNQLSGPLPKTLGSSSEFSLLDVSENLFTGEIPTEMCKQGNMTQLLIIQNKFTGGFPASYADCKTLTRVRVSNNSLSGVVPGGIWGLPNVGLIDLSLNLFEGPITSDIGNAKSLSQLLVSNNRFSGELPPEISEDKALSEIDVSNNQFSGPLPAKIGELNLLNKLYLQNNMFSGPIPESISSCVSLNDINMAKNSLSGEIPASLGSLPALNSLNLSENELSGQIPANLSSLKLNILDLSYNKLTGPIPQSISIEAYKGSFNGNDGLCSQKIKFFRRCSPASANFEYLRVVIIVVAAVAILLLLSVPLFLFLKKSQKDQDRSLKEDSWDVKSFHVLSFTEDEILDSIKQENLIGKGGSGSVYKVSLGNGIELAVKHIWNSDSGGRKRSGSTTPMLSKRGERSREFDAEVQTLSSIRHVNVVKLYCSITSEDSSLLVYEYMPNGSLWDRLHTSRKMALDWETRYEIAVGAAKGLEYLHHGCQRPVIHRDVKSSNILLDEFLKPRIADFGLAKINNCHGQGQGNSNKDSTTQVIAGTPGYIAPEYGYTYKVNEKSDVYSFGVVLMELVTGKRPIEPEYGENKDIVSWVASKLQSKESVMSIVDSTIQEAYREEAIKLLRIAILCTSRLPSLRPAMRSVVQMLEEVEPCKLDGIIFFGRDGSRKEEVKDYDKV